MYLIACYLGFGEARVAQRLRQAAKDPAAHQEYLNYRPQNRKTVKRVVKKYLNSFYRNLGRNKADSWKYSEMVCKHPLYRAFECLQDITVPIYGTTELGNMEVLSAVLDHPLKCIFRDLGVQVTRNKTSPLTHLIRKGKKLDFLSYIYTILVCAGEDKPEYKDLDESKADLKCKIKAKKGRQYVVATASPLVEYGYWDLELLNNPSAQREYKRQKLETALEPHELFVKRFNLTKLGQFENAVEYGLRIHLIALITNPKAVAAGKMAVEQVSVLPTRDRFTEKAEDSEWETDFEDDDAPECAETLASAAGQPE